VNLIFVVAGAGCGSMGRYLPQYFTGLEGESGLTRISVLQKPYQRSGQRRRMQRGIYPRRSSESVAR
jgi:hypothetical protein